MNREKRLYWWILFVLYLVVNTFERLNHKYLFIGWENDWKDFFERSQNFSTVFSFDGYRTFGYPFLVKLFSLITSDRIIAGEIVVAFSGLILLAGVFQLANLFLPAVYAFSVTILFLFNWHFAISTVLLTGTDILFATATIWGIVALVLFLRSRKLIYAAFLGLCFGLSYVFRYTGIIFLFILLLYYLLTSVKAKNKLKENLPPFLVCLLFFFLVSLPQMIINFRGGGSPFANYHAKNVYFGVSGYFEQYADKWSEIPDTISADEILSLGVHRILRHIIKESAKSCARVILMVFGTDIKTAKYFITPLINVILLVCFFVSSLVFLFFVKFDFKPFFKNNKSFLTFVILLFFIYTFVVSAVYSGYRFFTFFIPIIYIFLFASLRQSKLKSIAFKVGYIIFACGLIVSLVSTTIAFNRSNSFPVDKVLSSLPSDGNILLYGPYIHLKHYTKRGVYQIEHNMKADQILNIFSEGSYQYLIVVKSLPFRWEFPSFYPAELESLQQYNFRLVKKIDYPREIYIWERFELDEQ